MPSFRHRGVELWFELLDGDVGTVPRLFVNGSGSSLDDVRALLPRFAGPASLAALDHRGLGRSATPVDPSNMADFAADVVALADHLGWPTFDLIGVSFGGMVALEVVCRRADRTRRLVAMCTSPGGEGGSSYPLHELIDLDGTARRKIMPLLQDTRFDEQWLRTHDGLVERLISSPVDRPVTPGYRMQMEARRHHDVWSRIGDVGVPALVASGRHDGIAPPENGRRLADRLPHGHYVDYDGGHLFFLQDPTFFTDMEEFLSCDDVMRGAVL